MFQEGPFEMKLMALYMQGKDIQIFNSSSSLNITIQK